MDSYNFAYAENDSKIFIKELSGIDSPASDPTYSSNESGTPLFDNFGSYIYALSVGGG